MTVKSSGSPFVVDDLTDLPDSNTGDGFAVPVLTQRPCEQLYRKPTLRRVKMSLST